MWLLGYWPAALAAFMFGTDISRGIGGSNGRWISFLQSVESAYSYRVQRPYRAASVVLSPRTRIRDRRQSLYFAGSNRNEVWQRMYLGFICGLLKFGSGTVISIVLGLEPVLLKGWRHFASFAAALMCVQAAPKDMFFKVLSAPDVSGISLRFVMFMACAIYKLRKLTFVVHTVRNIGHGPAVAIFLSVLELEGSGVLRRLENHLMHVRWSWNGLKHVAFVNAQLLASSLNVWLSVTAASILYMGSHADDTSPFLYPLKWWSTIATLLILSVRYNRNTGRELLQHFKAWIWQVSSVVDHGAKTPDNVRDSVKRSKSSRRRNVSRENKGRKNKTRQKSASAKKQKRT